MKFRVAVAALALLAVVVSGSLRADDEKKEVKCPVSGQPAKAEHKVAFNGGEVTFCCPKCKKAFEEDSEKYAAKANLQLFQTGQIKQVKCPIAGRPMAADKIIEVEGTKVAVCCPGCLAKAKKATGDDLIVLLFTDAKKQAFEPVKK
jgi:YHS domain-containing protein